MSGTIGKKNDYNNETCTSWTRIVHMYFIIILIHICKHEDTDGLTGSNFVFELITSTTFDMALSGNATYNLISYASVNRLNGYHFVSSYHTPHIIHTIHHTNILECNDINNS